mgnify:CR=1 FL=1
MSFVAAFSAEVINELVSKGYTPVLAHPERYYVFQRHPGLLEEYLRSGLLLQANFTTLFNLFLIVLMLFYLRFQPCMLRVLRSFLILLNSLMLLLLKD